MSELEELRKRRHARESREVERERQVLLPSEDATRGTGFAYGGNINRYQDQFHPTLSRN